MMKSDDPDLAKVLQNGRFYASTEFLRSTPDTGSGNNVTSACVKPLMTAAYNFGERQV
jgi:hypothetical protein